MDPLRYKGYLQMRETSKKIPELVKKILKNSEKIEVNTIKEIAAVFSSCSLNIRTMSYSFELLTGKAKEEILDILMKEQERVQSDIAVVEKEFSNEIREKSINEQIKNQENHINS